MWYKKNKCHRSSLRTSPLQMIPGCFQMLLTIYVLINVEGYTLTTRRISARMNLELNLPEFSAVLATNGTAAVGSFCYYATRDIIYSSLLTSLLPCYNKASCSSECFKALTDIKARCYQMMYNNTEYNTLLLNAGFISQHEFTEYQGLNNPINNPWIRCNIDPPPDCM